MIEGSTIMWYIGINFVYTVKMGVYANSSSDIPVLDEIATPEEIMDLMGKEDNHGRDSF